MVPTMCKEAQEQTNNSNDMLYEMLGKYLTSSRTYYSGIFVELQNTQMIFTMEVSVLCSDVFIIH